MELWRSKAIESFPSLAPELEERDYGMAQLFFDLLPIWKDAHHQNDNLLLVQIHAFAEWCLDQQDYEIWNAAGVGFYQHLFDEHGIPLANITRFIPQNIMQEISDFLRVRHPPEVIGRLEKSLGYNLGPPGSARQRSHENDREI